MSDNAHPNSAHRAHQSATAPTATGEPMTRAPVKHERSAIVAMYAGIALTVVALIAPYVDRATGNMLADHIRAGYPTYTQARIDTAVTTYLVYVSIIGVLGVMCWVWTIRVINARKWWARGAATAMFALATGIALFDVLVKDTSGDTGLPALLGWIGVLPCVAGLLAVVLLWAKS